MNILKKIEDKLVPEWRSWWRQSSTQLAILSGVSEVLAWLSTNWQTLEHYFSPSVFHGLSLFCIVLLPIARNVVQSKVTEERNNAKGVV